MTAATASAANDDQQITARLINLLADMTTDWELDIQITEATYLIADLEFESIDVVQFVVAIGEEFGAQLPFELLLMKDGRYVDDLTVAEVSAFLAQHLPAWSHG